MGSIRDIANQPKTQSFPSSQYTIDGDVPAAQCTEAHLIVTFASTTAGLTFLTKMGLFAGFDLAGKTLTITFSVNNQGDYLILSNTDDVLTVDTPFTDGGPFNFGTVHDGGPTEVFSETGLSAAGTAFLTDPGHWVAGQHDGREVNIVFPPANIGTYTILASTGTRLTLDSTLPVTDAGNNYTIQDPDQSDLTRNAASFRRFIESQGRSHTTKGATLYTNTPTAEMQNACSVLFAPLT